MSAVKKNKLFVECCFLSPVLIEKSWVRKKYRTGCGMNNRMKNGCNGVFEVCWKENAKMSNLLRVFFMKFKQFAVLQKKKKIFQTKCWSPIYLCSLTRLPFLLFILIATFFSIFFLLLFISIKFSMILAERQNKTAEKEEK